MARPLRIEFAGALYHVTSRGDRQESFYESDPDRERFLIVLPEVCVRYNWQCHACCLMDNHYHMLVETPDANLGKGMRQLNGVYTQAFNFTHRCVGHVFQGRYKAILIDKDSYLLELAQYIVLNPVCAQIVRSAGEWPYYAEQHRTRKQAITSAYASGDYSLKEVGNYFGLHYSTGSGIINQRLDPIPFPS